MARTKRDKINQPRPSRKRSRIARFVWVAVFFLLLLLAVGLESLLGNDAVFSGDGVTVFPVKTADIQMVTDSVTIKRGGDWGGSLKL